MKGSKVILMVDNAPSHIVPKLQNVSVKFFPANTTSVCQPMDQGIIQTCKLKYRKRQLQHVLTQMDSKPGTTGPELLKQISVLDAIYWIARSWKDVEVSTIEKCFARCGFSATRETPTYEDDSGDEEDTYPIAVHAMAKNLFGCELKELLDIDKDFATCDTDLTDWDRSATELLKEKRASEESDEDCEETDKDEQLINEEPATLSDCVVFIDKMKAFARSGGHSKFMESLLDMEDIVTEITVDSKSKQTKINDFFTRQ